MPRIQRSSDVIEVHGERAFFYVGSGIALAAISGVLLKYQGSGVFVPVAVLLLLGAVGLVGFGGYWIFKAQKVSRFSLKCPFCFEVNELVSAPENDDTPCIACNRMIPILGGLVLAVNQVRCGFCNTLNYYSQKTEVLLCENCNHEVPIFLEDDGKPKKQLPKGFAIVEDNDTYELVLVDAGHKTEDLVSALQKTLALNRNQVKEILDSCPVSLLSGIPKMKADMLVAQINVHGARAESRVITGS